MGIFRVMAVLTMSTVPGTNKPVPVLAGGFDADRLSEKITVTTFETLDLETGIWSVLPTQPGGFSLPPGGFRPLPGFRAREGAIFYMQFVGARIPMLFEDGRWRKMPTMEAFKGLPYTGLSISRASVCA